MTLRLHDFVPPFAWGYDAKLMLFPVAFYAAAVVVPFPVMLLFAFTMGLLWDGRYAVITGNEQIDLEFGYSILLFALMGSLMQGIRPMFRRGRWELPVLMVGIATMSYLVVEFLFLNFRRGEFYFPKEIWYKIWTSALLSVLVAPFFFLGLHWLAKKTNFKIRYEGLYRYSQSRT
ncbi:MAG: hypothetical protein AAGJ79_05205 [Verrucomicrobiota bacterium]